MKKPLLRYLHCPDFDNSHETASSSLDSFFVQAMIGLVDSDVEESFQFFVCTPKWVAIKIESADYLFGKDMLVVSKADLTLVHAALTDLCDSLLVDDWESAAKQLGKYGHWEFDDYREQPSVP